MIILLSTAFFIEAHSQLNSILTDTLRKDALNVYMENTDYIRKEIPYINYVRDIKDAGVYIISTVQHTGSGGREYTYFFVGQNQYKGMADTLSFTSPPDETDDETRIKQVNTLQLGLIRFVARTPLAKHLKITYTQPMSEKVSTDRWNSWVFRASINGYLNKEQSYETTYLNGNVSASRVTEAWKISLRARYGYSIEKFDIDEEIISSENTSRSFSSLIVKSISDHWSVGGTINLGAGSYRNLKNSVIVMPGIEYDLFPYSEATRRQLRLLYSIGYNAAVYIDTTIYDKTSEAHLQHSILAAYEVVQKWGTIDISAEYSNYLHDWSLNNLSVFGRFELRIAKGLSLNLGGGASLIHDQLGLVKGGATTEEVLLRRKEIATQFSYWTNFGFSYTFGSIYNNVVNPRFGNSGSGGQMMYISY
ncbi:MAG: hypothetical protein A2X05_13030 [Bacteroidetes bacterium GWE2_41_25]|nr:MAG: hypothetical protein A2X03_08935 [Bacteroidetes bacterium GWA2_40_15]OFX94189.1 MAG: hypothetical protein A2X06_16255 [Bacteroidetes bacterium GWC2_40_22]OFY10029.1 MAG: hypothetical protein A2X05_13030 [Bacteroidetes bacterium GWE2_41_25]HBQ83609.1 hypothetical protein [Bacteroidales bacterium]HCU20691.1 hypothetical protein [Bacteroidales bacterium]